MTKIFHHINQYCIDHRLLPPGSTVILGLSGGPDSIFLLHYLHALQQQGTITLIAAHLDHGWRTNSHHDVEFCAQATAALGVKFITAQLSDLQLSLKFNGSQEEFGRKARRHFLQTIAHEYNAQAIALAHHADDQQETFFIRLVRGASLTGLTGMRPHHGIYVRPLLTTYKTDIVTYLKEHNISFLTDPTNTADTFLRNRIRNNVLPALHAADSRFAANFMRTVDQLQDTEDFLQHVTMQTWEQLLITRTPSTLSVPTFLALHPVLQHRILVHWLSLHKAPFTPSQALFAEIIRFLNTPRDGAHQLHTTWELHKKKGIMWLQTATDNQVPA